MPYMMHIVMPTVNPMKIPNQMIIPINIFEYMLISSLYTNISLYRAISESLIAS